MRTWPSQYGKGNRYLKGDHRRHPVEQVSWEECVQALLRFGLVLPTEAQWEAAARAHTGTPWWCGPIGADVQGSANLLDRSIEGVVTTAETPEPWNDGHTHHAPVGSFRPNAFGLHDMLGNVCEWCLDAYVNDQTSARREGDALLLVPPERQDKRSFRGGSFQQVAPFARSAIRSGHVPVYRGAFLGCRPALALASR
jgi:formylglycine-generating enzyme required for sulfatase activity